MRLGTLARKINITPSQLTSFLESQSIDLPSGTNTKLTEQQIEQVLFHFNATLTTEPEPIEEIEEGKASHSETPLVESETSDSDNVDALEVETELKEQEVSPPKTKFTESFAEIALPHELEDSEEHHEGTPHDTEVEYDAVEEPSESNVPVEIDPEIESSAERAAYDESIEVIKPQKVTLPGLKVKGKIDLPEPKVKSEENLEEEKPLDPDAIITTTGPKRERRRKPKNKRGRKYDKDYNPIEAERKRKAREEKKKKEQAERLKKKAKTRHYQRTVTTTQPITAKKKKGKKEHVRQESLKEQQTGNFLQRFWRWMNT